MRRTRAIRSRCVKKHSSGGAPDECLDSIQDRSRLRLRCAMRSANLSAGRSQRWGESRCGLHHDSEGEPHLPVQVAALPAQQPVLPETAPGAEAAGATAFAAVHSAAFTAQQPVLPATAPGAEVAAAPAAQQSAFFSVAQQPDALETAPGAVFEVELHAPRNATSERQARVVRVFIE